MARGCRSPDDSVRRARPSARAGRAAAVRTGHVAILALAAALVLAVGVSLVMLVLRSARGSRRRRRQPAPAQARRPACRRGRADGSRAGAEADGERRSRTWSRSRTPTHRRSIRTTAATLDKNLGIIDQAIAETRAAVKSEPASVTARGALFEALKQKVPLLQDTIALINEMRKGNTGRGRDRSSTD